MRTLNIMNNIYDFLTRILNESPDENTAVSSIPEFRIEDIESIDISSVRDAFTVALMLKKPSGFFEALKNLSILKIHFPEIYRLIGAVQPERYHPEGDSFAHTMLVLDYAAERTEDFPVERKLEVRFSALVHDFGKGVTPKEEYPHHYKHEINGIPVIKEFTKRLGLSQRLMECGITSSKEHMRGGIFDSMKPQTRVSFIESVAGTELGLDGLQIVVDADRLSNACFFKNDGYTKVDFESVGRQLVTEINENSVREKYGITDAEKLKEKMHQLRIDFIKQIMKK